MKNNMIVLAVVVAFAFGAGGFFGGMKYRQSNDQMMRFGRQGFRPVTGEISMSDDTAITVKLQDGSSKVILLSESTTINKSAEGTKTDLATGQRVSVFGTENSDGSVTAQNIQLGLPAQTGGMFRGQMSTTPDAR